ncbi:MAG: helix-turn-helix domain-containing protein, partial [Bacteroidota bacterium]
WPLHFALLLGVSFWVGYRFPNTHNPLVFGFYWMRIIYAIWFVYILAAGWTIRASFRKIFQKDEKHSALDFWVISIFLGNLIIWLAYYLVGYISYIVGALSFSFIFYVLVTLIYFRKSQSGLFDKSLKYANKTIDSEDIATITNGLKVLMDKEKIYIQPDLKLSDLASKLKVSTHTLSQFLNERLGKSFPSYINEYRIQEAKQLIRSDHRIKLEAVAYDSGFNSKSTFNAAFKKITGVTPSKFKEQLS